MRYCICGKEKKKQIGTVEYFIQDFKIVIHRVPHFLCGYCGTRSYDSKENIIELLKWAYKSRIGELDYENDREKLRSD